MSNPTTLVFDETNAAADTLISAPMRGLAKFDFFVIDAALVGATGGTLDVYLQREIATNVWRDWCHYTQLASGGAAVNYSHFSGPGSSSSIVTVGVGDATTATPALAANTFIGGHPGDALRMVLVAGAGSSADANIVIRVNAWRGR